MREYNEKERKLRKVVNSMYRKNKLMNYLIKWKVMNEESRNTINRNKMIIYARIFRKTIKRIKNQRLLYETANFYFKRKSMKRSISIFVVRIAEEYKINKKVQFFKLHNAIKTIRINNNESILNRNIDKYRQGKLTKSTFYIWLQYTVNRKKIRKKRKVKVNMGKLV